MGDAINIFIIPLIGGFLFVILSKLFRHRVLRNDGQYLFFLSASFGLFFLILSYFFTEFFTYYLPSVASFWKRVVPFPYSGTSVGAVILALLSSIIFFFMQRDKVIRYIINSEGDAIEKMIWEALRKALMICVTLENDKVYVGFVANPFESGSIRFNSLGIIPSLSGYRDQTKSIQFTNYYEDILEGVEEKPEDYTVSKSNVIVSIPLSRIVSINYFDPAIYHKFNEGIEEELAI